MKPSVLTCLLAVALAATGCSSPRASATGASVTTAPPPLVLLPGDTVRVSFAAAPQLDTAQQIRRDGRLNLPLVGEVVAADRTPAELELELRQAYGEQLRSGDLTITVVSSSYPVFVTGAVIRPGRVSPDRPITALGAVMQAGGFDAARANLHRVVVLRQKGERTERTVLNLKAALEGGETAPFFLEAYDVVYVPERLIWF